MIRQLYQKHRLQIILAFLLVVIENAAYIAEPYVFGKAIDGLREAQRIEEEVDSSLTNTDVHRIADSVRVYLLDSLRSENVIEANTSVSTEPTSIEVKNQLESSVKDDAIIYAASLTAAKPSDSTALDVSTKTDQPISFNLPNEVGPFLPPLIPWVLLFLIHSAIGSLRRLYDTKLYTKMFAQLSSEVVAKQLDQGEELSKVAARSTMAWRNIEFFQYSVPEFLEQLIAVTGAVVALGLFDWRLTVIGLGLIICVMFGSKYYIRVMHALQVKLHDRYEDEYNVFNSRDPKKIKKHYSDIADLEIKQSKRSTASYAVLRVLLLIMFLSTLYISVDMDHFSIGSLYSIVAYVWSFVTATEYIPYLSEKWVALKDSSRRINVTKEEPVIV